MSGLFVANDKRNVQISSDVTPLSYKQTIIHDYTTARLVLPVGNEDGTFNVWHRGEATNPIHHIGLFQAGYSAPIFMGKHVGTTSSTLLVEQHIFSSKPVISSGVGLQMFNANGIETYNSEKPLLSIIDKISLRPEDAYRKTVRKDFDGTLIMDRTLWEKTYPGYTKLGLLFTNVPGGIFKEPAYYQIWSYAYNFRTAGNTINIAFRAEYFSWSGTSASIPMDDELKFEFFVVDLSNIV